jgi:hypothetical protein
MEVIKRAGITRVYYGAGPDDVVYQGTSIELNVEHGVLREQCLELVSVKYPLP